MERKPADKPDERRVGAPVWRDPVPLRTAIERVHLETALALALHGNFTRTAEALGMKKSTVNRRIRDLEFQLGTAIFERNRLRISPTPAGRTFLDRAGTLLDEFHGLVQAIRRTADGKTGTVAIGFHGLSGIGSVGNLLFASRSPLAGISLIPLEMSTDALAEALACHRVDVALFRGPITAIPGRDLLPLPPERMAVALPADHVLAQTQVTTWQALAGETILLSRPDFGDALVDHCRERLATCAPGAVAEVHGIGTLAMLGLVSRSRGLLVSTEALRATSIPGVVVRDLDETLEVNACWNAESFNPAIARFLRLLCGLQKAAGVDHGALAAMA